MHIALIAREFPPAVGGMEVLAWNLAKELARSDDVTVFTGPDGGVPDAPFDQRRVLGKSLWEDAERLRDDRPDVWLALNAKYAAVASKLHGAVCVYCHGNDFLNAKGACTAQWVDKLRDARYFWRFRGRIARSIGRRNLRDGLSFVDEVFTNSGNSADLFERLYGRRPVVVCPGVNEEFFCNLADRPQSDWPGLRVLTVSRLKSGAKRKNVDGVIRAIASLPEGLGVHYTVVGDGDDRPRLERLARELCLGDSIRFTGAIPDAELHREYREADLFVMASKADARDVEGFGIVYLEACASGTPVLCSREGGATDAVADGENGVLIDRSDPESIAAGIRRFASMREVLTPAKAQRFADHYRWPKVAERIRGHLLQVVENGHRAQTAAHVEGAPA